MPKIVDSNTVTWSESSNELSATVGGDVVVDSVVIDDGGTIGSASASSAIAIDSSGNVGIGTSSPTAPLAFGKSVYGDPSSENFYRIKFEDVGGIANDVGIGQPDTGSMAFNFGPSLKYIAFRAGTSGERMRITSSGNVGIGTTSPGAELDVDGNIIADGVYLGGTAAANLLDDYEEGTFTPTIFGTTTAGSGTYGVQAGQYTKIGNIVHYHIHINWSAHTGTGDIRISGLPFTVFNNAAYAYYMSTLYTTNMTLPANTVSTFAYASSNSTTMVLRVNRDATGDVGIPMDTSASIFTTGTYRVN